MKLKLFLLSLLSVFFALPAHAVTCPTGMTHCAILSWSPPSTSGTSRVPTGYNIYESLTNGGCNTLTATTCTKAGIVATPTTTYTAGPLTASTTYYFVLTSFDAKGESAGSAQVSGTTSTDTLGAPGSIVIQLQ